MGQELNGGTGEVDRFGFALALSNDGQTLAVGTFYENGFGNDKPGYVQVYRFDAASSSWIEHGQRLVGSADGINFGLSVDMTADASVLVVGSSRATTDVGGFRSGAVYTYRFLNGLWQKMGPPIEGLFVVSIQFDEMFLLDNKFLTVYTFFKQNAFGVQVGVSDDGSFLAATAPLSNHDGLDSGSVRFFESAPIE